MGYGFSSACVFARSLVNSAKHVVHDIDFNLYVTS